MQEARYKAFISYSHQDDQWAAWLHRALESYRPPRRLIGQPTKYGSVPKRLAPVFRDREELPTATDLGAVISEALVNSACQLVLCSPAAARSKWVNEEIKAYKRLGREDRIFCLIIGGEPNATDMPGREHEECFPQALRYKLGPDGELSHERAEPIAADARKDKDGRSNAKLKLIAGMLGVGFDALKQRELHRRQVRLTAIATAAIAGMVVTSGLAVSALLARAEAEDQRVRAEAEAETARQTTSFLVDLFKVSDPSEALGNTITAREILDKGAARIDEELKDQPAIQTTLMETIGAVYTSLGLYEPAAALLQDALDKRVSLYGDEHLEVAHVLSSLGEVLRLKADFAQAEAMYRAALAISRAQLGNEHAEVARLEYALGDVLGQMGDFLGAEPLFRDSLESRRKLFGDESIEVAQSLEGLGLNLFDEGNYQDPVPLLREAVSLRRRLHGGPHPDFAEALNNLGFVLHQLGEYGEAVELFGEALEMKRFLLGDTHPEIAMGLNNVAVALHDQGKYDDAEAMYREALGMQRKLLGSDHPEVAMALNNLAFLLYEKGERDEAVAMSRESLEMYRRTVGDEHPSVARSMANLGMWLTEEKDYAAAEKLLRDSLALRRSLLGAQHADTAASMTLLADLLIETGEFEEARALAAEARAIGSATLSDTHWRTASAASAEGAALAGLHEYPEAEQLLLGSLDVLQNDTGALPVSLTNTRRRLAALYAAWGRAEDAARYLAMLGNASSPATAIAP